MGLSSAHTTAIQPDCKDPVIDLLPEQRHLGQLGASMRLGGYDVEIKKGTRAHAILKTDSVRRRFRHRFECNPSYIQAFEDADLVFSGKAPGRDIMQILELPNHPFFMASQFHPELTSRPLAPDPFYLEFYKAAIVHMKKKSAKSTSRIGNSRSSGPKSRKSKSPQYPSARR